MIWVGLAVAGCAAALHVFIFYLESFAWTTRARGVFGTSAEEAEATRELAFNQGFYNLFLAIVVALGIVVHAVGHEAVGLTLLWSGIGSAILYKIVDVIVGLRVTSDEAREGLDIAAHGERAYNYGASGGAGLSRRPALRAGPPPPASCTLRAPRRCRRERHAGNGRRSSR